MSTGQVSLPQPKPHCLKQWGQAPVLAWSCASELNKDGP